MTNKSLIKAENTHKITSTLKGKYYHNAKGWKAASPGMLCLWWAQWWKARYTKTDVLVNMHTHMTITRSSPPKAQMISDKSRFRLKVKIRKNRNLQNKGKKEILKAPSKIICKSLCRYDISMTMRNPCDCIYMQI